MTISFGVFSGDTSSFARIHYQNIFSIVQCNKYLYNDKHAETSQTGIAHPDQESQGSGIGKFPEKVSPHISSRSGDPDQAL
jgi:hypothetical protein